MARCEVLCCVVPHDAISRGLAFVGADVEGTSRVAGGRVWAEQNWGILIGRL